MIVPTLAGLLLALAVQEPPTSGDPAPTATGLPSDERSGDEPAPQETEEEAEVEAPEVCRRVVTYDDFGRQRSRRVCRPR